MNSSLKLLFEAIQQVETQHDLQSHIVPKIGEHFAATRRGIFLFDSLNWRRSEQFPLDDGNLRDVLRVALSVKHNPLARYLVEHHAPVHDALVTSPKAWRMICPRRDHWHVMAGPIINRNQIVGVVGCTRSKSMPAFDTQNLTDLSAICLHLSVWAATVSSQNPEAAKFQHQPFKTTRLTPRELEIAQLVANGQTNAQIGNQLWITENSVKQALKRMFRKLEVSSRAEMVARLSAPNFDDQGKQQSTQGR